ncbi:MAG: hypothetical protein U0872_01195 [Planctomycetaceae bacterium]
MNRRARLIVLWAAALLTTHGSGQNSSGDEPAPDRRKNDAALRELRRHRVLYNGDCDFLIADDFYIGAPDAKFTKEPIHRFIDLLADSGVDTYLCNANAQLPYYPSRRTPNHLTGYKRDDWDFVRGNIRLDWDKQRAEETLREELICLNRFLDLEEAGVNWVEEVSRACRRRGISPWLSVRMNDMHGQYNWDGSYLNCALQRDPRFRLSGRQPNPQDPINPKDQSLNFAHQEVRDYLLLMTRELVEDYDFEGLELDWLRTPYCLDAPASPEQIEMMTQWHGEIRSLCEAKAARTGKPYPLGLRVPIQLERLRAVGIDVPTLVKRGIVDFVNVSNIWQSTWDVPYDELRRELGPDVKIYGVTEAAANWMNVIEPGTGKKGYRFHSSSAELLRGNAAGKLVLGVDGIETYNFFAADARIFNPFGYEHQAQYPALKTLADLESLRGLPKQYTLQFDRSGWRIQNWEWAQQLPANIEPTTSKSFRLSMCREPTDAGLELVVQVIVDRTDVVPELGVSFNGGYPVYDCRETDQLIYPAGNFTHHLPEHRAVEFRLPAADIREGWNIVQIYNGSHQYATPQERRDNTMRVVGLDLGIVKSPVP